MTKAVRVHKVGGPEALVYEDVDVPAPGPGEVRIRQHAVGLNFIDVYFRTGLYKAPGLPFIAGNEAAGEVVAVGPGVTNFHPGDRVAYYFTLGGYASERVIPADKLVKLPDHITYEQGAVLMLKGLTVWYLLHKTFKVEPGHRVLIHAAAGGIGLLACQWAKALGAHVIGTVGSKAKADLALSNGCDHVILYNEEDFVARVKQISRNELCDVVYDGVGKTTFPGSLSCLRPRGLFVSFGNASGPVPPFALAELNNHGSLFATRPKLNDYVSHPQGTARRRRHAVRRRHQRQAPRADQPRLCAEGCGEGAYRAGEPGRRRGRRSCGRRSVVIPTASCASIEPEAIRRVRARDRRWLRVRLGMTTRCTLRHPSRRTCLDQNRIKAIDHQRYLLARDVERRHEAQRIGLRRVEEHAVRKRLGHDRGADRQFEIERQQQTPAAHFAEAMPRRQFLQLAFQKQAGIRHRFQEFRLGDVFEHRKPRRAHQRIAVEGAALVAVLEARGMRRSRAGRPAARRRRCPCRAS